MKYNHDRSAADRNERCPWCGGLDPNEVAHKCQHGEPCSRKGTHSIEMAWLLTAAKQLGDQSKVDGVRAMVLERIAQHEAHVEEKRKALAHQNDFPVVETPESWEGSDKLGRLDDSMRIEDIEAVLAAKESQSMATRSASALGEHYAETYDSFRYEFDATREEQTEWVLVFADGRRATIYEENGQRWFVGGHHIAMVNRVAKILDSPFDYV